jgi:hypothetical protein
MPYVPHITLLLQSLRITPERLGGRAKIAIEAALLRALLRIIAAGATFDAAFDLATYPDIAAAHEAGLLDDPHRHFIELGFFEGRQPAPPPVDEAFYLDTYADISAALRHGEITSCAEHYVRRGAAEGRVPNAALLAQVQSWAAILAEPGRA